MHISPSVLPLNHNTVQNLWFNIQTCRFVSSRKWAYFLSLLLSLPWFLQFSFDVSLALCTRRELKIKDERREAPRPKLDSCFLERTEKLVGWKLKVNVSSLSTKCRLHASRIRSRRRAPESKGTRSEGRTGIRWEGLLSPAATSELVPPQKHAQSTLDHQNSK